MKTGIYKTVSTFSLFVIWILAAFELIMPLMNELEHSKDPNRKFLDICIIPLAATLTFFSLNLVRRHPQLINLPFRLTEEKKRKALAYCQNMCVELKCLFMVWYLVDEALTWLKLNRTWLVLCIIFCVFCIILIVKMYSNISKLYHGK